jgi:hypothetical protein
MEFQLVQTGAPQLSVRLEPFVELYERLRPNPIETTLAVGTRCDQPRVA